MEEEWRINHKDFLPGFYYPYWLPLLHPREEERRAMGRKFASVGSLFQDFASSSISSSSSSSLPSSVPVPPNSSWSSEVDVRPRPREIHPVAAVTVATVAAATAAGGVNGGAAGAVGGRGRRRH